MKRVSPFKNKLFNFNFEFTGQKTDQTTYSSRWFSSKASKWKFFFVSYILITLIFCPYFRWMVSDFIEENENAFYYFFFGASFFNIFIFSRFVTLKEYRVDLFIKYLNLFSKNLFFFLNFIKIKITKVLFFIFSNKLAKLFAFLKSISVFVLQKFLIWRPLFKRFSYFGNYKSSRNKFIIN